MEQNAGAFDFDDGKTHLLKLHSWPSALRGWSGNEGVLVLIGNSSVEISGKGKTMARRGQTPPEPQPANLAVEDMKAGIRKLERRLGELQAFDLTNLDPDDPEIDKFANKIEMTMVEVFGKGTRAIVKSCVWVGQAAARSWRSPLTNLTPRMISAR